MGTGYSFDDDEDDGIFADSEKFAAGDPVAKADINASMAVPMITLGRDGDGFTAVLDSETDIMKSPEAVDFTNLICLGGPCKYYTENARLVPEGPGIGADENVEVGRWCGRVRTWAEQLDLTEAKIYACTAYEPSYRGDSETIRSAIVQNVKNLAEINRQRVTEQAKIGVCCEGPCQDYVEMLVKAPTSDDRESRRWCVRLGGLGRLYDLRDRPVVACTGWLPTGSSPELAEIARRNIERITQCRKAMADRPNKEKEEEDA